MSSKVPDRWQDYSRVGRRINGTRFVAFKVPLRKEICRRLPEDLHFTPDDLVKFTSECDQKLGHVIDLTNTTRYYDKQSLLGCGLGYDKVFTEGHVVPSKSVQKRFSRVLDSFLKENSENDLLLGVHCTHGVNRTGYLLCRYMIDEMAFDPEDAIAAFNEARGHEIERKNYLQDLRSPKSVDKGDEVEDSLSDELKRKQEKVRRSRNSHYHNHCGGSWQINGGNAGRNWRTPWHQGSFEGECYSNEGHGGFLFHERPGHRNFDQDQAVFHQHQVPRKFPQSQDHFYAGQGQRDRNNRGYRQQAAYNSYYSSYAANGYSHGYSTGYGHQQHVDNDYGSFGHRHEHIGGGGNSRSSGAQYRPSYTGKSRSIPR